MKREIITFAHDDVRRAKQFPDLSGQAIIRPCSLNRFFPPIMSLSCSFVLPLACFSLLLGACAGKQPVQDEKVTPPAVFKAHPGLLGQPVPPELRPIETPVVESTQDDGEFSTAAPTEHPVERGDAAIAEGGQYSVYFDYRSTDIKPDYAATLRALGQRLAVDSALFAQVEGNADERGGARYNQNLGMRRAQAVAKVLRAAGAKRKQMKVVSYGDDRPRRQGKDENSWAENRRADVVLSGGKK